MSISGLSHNQEVEVRAYNEYTLGNISREEWIRILDQEAALKTIGLPPGETEPYWDSVIGLRDVLGPEAANGFTGRVVSRLGTVQAWYESCHEHKVNPLSDEGWAHGV